MDTSKPRKRRPFEAALIAGLTALMPIASATAESTSVTGAIDLPGQPLPARLVYLTDPGLNGIEGYVIPLGGPVLDGTAYKLTRLSSLGTITMSAIFLSDLFGNNGEGYACRSNVATGNASGGEDGAIVCGDSNGDGVTTAADRARYAIVTIDPVVGHSHSVSAGAMARFKFRWDS